MRLRRMVQSLLAPAMLAIALGGSTGCASLEHVPVDSFDEPGGIPYYEGAWYLLLHGDGKGNISSKLMFLPDKNRKRVAKPRNVVASLKSTLEFKNGVLAGSKEVADTSAVPTALVSAARQALPLLLATRGPTDDTTAPAPSIYKVEVRGTSFRFIGGPGDTDVVINVPEAS